MRTQVPDPVTEQGGVVVQMEAAHAAAHERARAHQRERASRSVPQQRAAAPSHTAAPPATVATEQPVLLASDESPPPSVSAPEPEATAQPRATTTTPEAPAMSTSQSPRSPVLAALRLSVAAADLATEWVARRALRAAPGAAIGLVVAKATGVDLRLAMGVGAAVATVAAVGVDFALRDASVAPEAGRIRRAVTGIQAALGRGVTQDQVVDDMTLAGWPRDTATRMVAAVVGMAGKKKKLAA